MSQRLGVATFLAALATVAVAVEKSGLVLQRENAEALHVPFIDPKERRRSTQPRKVTIFNDLVLADDAGDEAAEWFSAVLGRRSRLVRTGESYTRKVPSEEKAQQHRPHYSSEISFTDAFPTLLTSEESLADLNNRLATPLPMDRFRPNIVLRGCAPYEENTRNVVRVGDLLFGCANTCLRCVITSTNQQTGVRAGVEPLRTLATYRLSQDGRGVMFGQYLIHSGTGQLRVGDHITAERL